MFVVGRRGVVAVLFGDKPPTFHSPALYGAVCWHLDACVISLAETRKGINGLLR